jgi:peptidoglycan/LPS O-acetylase OafA/YrhL
MGDILFSFVISAELVVDIFFWLTAFLGTYFMLIKIQASDGVLGSPLKIYLYRIFRLLPTYAFTMFFFWKVMVLHGGEGPRFFMYNEST